MDYTLAVVVVVGTLQFSDSRTQSRSMKKYAGGGEQVSSFKVHLEVARLTVLQWDTAPTGQSVLVQKLWINQIYKVSGSVLLEFFWCTLTMQTNL